jgi:nucleotide-binding universal stress UspA family protein
MALCDQFNAELHLLHVVSDIPPALVSSGGDIPATMLQEQDHYQQQIADELASLIPREWEGSHRFRRMTREGPPFVRIIEYAKETEADIIVLGTHGRSALMQMLLGSVAERVVRKAPCPVLTVRPEGHQFVMP